MHSKDGGAYFEQFACQVTRTAVATGTVVELAWVGACVTQKVLQCGNVQTFGCVGIHHQDIGHTQHLCDGGKVSRCVVGHATVEPRVDRMCGCGGDANDCPIWCCLGHHLCSDIAASTGSVFDDHRAQTVFDLLRQGACGDVNRTTRRIGHDQANGFCGGLCMCHCQRAQADDDGRGQSTSGGGVNQSEPQSV